MNAPLTRGQRYPAHQMDIVGMDLGKRLGRPVGLQTQAVDHRSDVSRLIRGVGRLSHRLPEGAYYPFGMGRLDGVDDPVDWQPNSSTDLDDPL